MNTQQSAVSRGGLAITVAATTGRYTTVATVDISQTKLAAPVTDACLLNRFQLACAMAATKIRARAVAFTERLQVRALAGTTVGALEVSVPGGVGSRHRQACRCPGTWRRSVQAAPP